MEQFTAFLKANGGIPDARRHQSQRVIEDIAPGSDEGIILGHHNHRLRDALTYTAPPALQAARRWLANRAVVAIKQSDGTTERETIGGESGVVLNVNTQRSWELNESPTDVALELSDKNNHVRVALDNMRAHPALRFFSTDEILSMPDYNSQR